MLTSQLLTQKWHELLVLTTCAFNVIQTIKKSEENGRCIGKQESEEDDDEEEDELKKEMKQSMIQLIQCLDKMMLDKKKKVKKKINVMRKIRSSSSSALLRQFEDEAAPLIKSLCKVRIYLKMIRIRLEEYVLLKIIVMTSRDNRCEDEDDADDEDAKIIDEIHDKYLNLLRIYCKNEEKREKEILNSIVYIKESANLLINSKMFYVPFLLTANI